MPSAVVIVGGPGARVWSSGPVHRSDRAGVKRGRALAHVHACGVTGNKKSKIYHGPGRQLLKSMPATSKENVRYATEEGAVKAGQQKSQK